MDDETISFGDTPAGKRALAAAAAERTAERAKALARIIHKFRQKKATGTPKLCY
jgi:hypothetical protein